MRWFGYPKETQGATPWKDKPMRIIDGKTWWFEDCGVWWCEETAEEFTDEEYVGRMKRLSKILNEPRIGFVKEHGKRKWRGQLVVHWRWRWLFVNSNR